MSWYASLGLRRPIVQAALGGGISTADLAIAVSRAGGLGTIGIMPEREFAAEIARSREALGETPFAANLLMPLLRRGHVRACVDQRVPVVSVFYGHDPAVVRELKAAGSYVVYQVGTADEAQAVVNDGADALIVQGVEAGGHVRSTERLDVLLPEVLSRLRPAHPDLPVLAAGGIYDAASARRALELGADGVAVGTRFLLTPESNAHDAYKQQLLDARDTLYTDLFGFGWQAPHRVAPNAATRRWCRGDGRGPRWLARLNTLSEAPSRLLPLSVGSALVRAEHPRLPFFSPFPLSRGMAPRTEVAPLYAGEGVTRIKDIRPAADIVDELAAAFAAP
ncbi:2-nitropropane dioxygenase [Salinisphaera sp. PC39]|uniref:NAD(P)H-dependent flavin oxidoreductase n=1 Tax=Salinisphaera sp. PC39 TaxID=1304156 RepID=UPI00333EA4F5